MNRKQITITIDAGPTDKPACEGHEVALLSQYGEAFRIAVAAIPGAAIVDLDLEIIEPSAASPVPVRFNELAL